MSYLKTISDGVYFLMYTISIIGFGEKSLKPILVKIGCSESVHLNSDLETDEFFLQTFLIHAQTQGEFSLS